MGEKRRRKGVGVREGRRGERICRTNVKLLPIRACERLHDGKTYYLFVCIRRPTVLYLLERSYSTRTTMKRTNFPGGLTNRI